VTAREAAVRALVAFSQGNTWSDLFLNSLLTKEGITGRDAALASRICYGVLQNGTACQWYAEMFLDGSFDRLQPVVREILKSAVYQMVFMDKIPARAAVSEAVELVKKLFATRARQPLSNAVLRKLSASLDRLPPLPDDGT
jgi:16S rRNA (cytosine967-C5)-methyltransferase